MKKRRPAHSIKEKRWLKRTVELGNGTQAAMEVYNVNGKESARAIASQNFRKLSMDNALKAKGLTEYQSAKKLKQGLESMKIHGTTDDFIKIKDMPTRHRYLETLLRLQGHGPNTSTNINIGIDNRKQYWVKLPERDED